MARQITRHMGGPTIITLLNGHKIKPSLNDFCTHRSAYLYNCIRGTYICSKWILTQKPITNKGAENESLSNAHYQVGHVYHVISYKGSGIILEEGAERL